jgi:hypothetical protein
MLLSSCWAVCASTSRPAPRCSRKGRETTAALRKCGRAPPYGHDFEGALPALSYDAPTSVESP